MRDLREEIRRRLEPLRLSPIRESEIVDELAQHCEDRYRELRASGASEADAHAAALNEIADDESLRREVARVERPAPLDLPPPGAARRGRWLSGLWQDLRLAARRLRRAPAFTFTVLAAFALTIGPTTAIVSVGNWLMWRPQPGVGQPQQLAQMYVAEWNSDTSMSPRSLTRETVQELLSNSATLDGLAGGQELGASLSVPNSLPRQVGTAHVTGDYFRVLGLRMRAGRAIQRGDDRLGAPHVAVLSETTARKAFGSPENALDKTVTLNNRPFTVVGVVDRSFDGIAPTSEIEAWVPATSYFYMRHVPEPRDTSYYSFIARLKPGATASAAASEANGRLRALFTRDPKTHSRLEDVEARVFPGLGETPLMRPHRRTQVRTMMAIAATLLLLGCANVANLLLFRTTRGQHEIAVRKALGASRARLIQAQVTESCMLALTGAGIGLGLAFFLKQLMQRLMFPRPPGMEFTVPVDGRVLGATVVAAIATGIVAALAPALMAARRQSSSGLRAGGRASTASVRLRGALASLQLALSLTLLVGALLLVTTLRNLRHADIGFNPAGVTAMYASPVDHGYKPADVVGYVRTVLAGIGERGDVQRSAAGVGALDSAFHMDVPRLGGGKFEITTNGVTHRYFETLGIPILRGREFNEEEAFAVGGDPPIIITASLAMEAFGTLDVVGRELVLARRSQERRLPIIGVAGNVRTGSLTQPPYPVMYQPFGRFDGGVRRAEFLVKSPMPALRAGAMMAGLSSRAAATVPLSGIRPLTTDIDRQLSRERLFAWLLGLLGSVGFVLASLGLYGLVSQTTTERRREFGIRVAIGASRRDVAALVARYALAVCLVGIVFGLAGAYYGTRLVDTMLVGVTRLDPRVYAIAVATLLAVVTAACVGPARRAIRVQPVEVLRAE